MHIFADHCVNTELVESLIEATFKVERAIDKGMAGATDEVIFSYTLKHSRTLLTFDKDFGNIIRFRIEDSRGIVIVYVEKMTRKEIIHRTINFFRSISEKKLRGSLFIIEPKGIRVWHH